MNEKIVSAVYVAYGLIDIAISALSSQIIIHMIVLGVICLAAGAGLWMGKDWSVYPVVFFGPITLTVGLVTLYSSISLNGFSSSMEALLFNLALVGYSVAALALFAYTVASRRRMLKPSAERSASAEKPNQPAN